MAGRNAARYARAMAFELGGEIHEVESEIVAVKAIHRDLLKADLEPLQAKLAALKADAEAMLPRDPQYMLPLPSPVTTKLCLRQSNAKLGVVRSIGTQTDAPPRSDDSADDATSTHAECDMDVTDGAAEPPPQLQLSLQMGADVAMEP